MIDHKFLYFKTNNSFLLHKHDISPSSIVFIEDLQCIWTHGVYFGKQQTIQDDKSKGYFSNLRQLKRAIPNPKVGDWAVVGSNDDSYIAVSEYDGTWTVTSRRYAAGLQSDIDLSEYITQDQLKTINMLSLVGTGNIQVECNCSNNWVLGDNLPIKLGSVTKLSLFDNDCGFITLNDILEQPSYNCPKHIFMTQQLYDALTEYEPDAIYFILNTWQLGGNLPIILN